MSDLRLFGYHVREDEGFSKIKKSIENEMGIRARTAEDPSGRQSDPKFVQAVADFANDYKEFGSDLLKKAQGGGKIDPKDVTTLDRAERLFAMAKSGGDKRMLDFRIASLDNGKDIFVHGASSLTRQVMRAAGLEDKEVARSGEFNVSVDYSR